MVSEENVAKSSALGILAGGLVLWCCVFNLILCYINTQGYVSVSNGTVGLFEVGTVIAGFWLIIPYVPRQSMYLMALVLLFLLGLKMLNPGLNLKICIDLLIMYAFFKLGTQVSERSAIRLLWITMLVVLAVGSFELVNPVLFGHYFDVFSYYQSKGTLSASVIDYSQSGQFVSSNRGDVSARTFLPGLLGTHRVSSVFLEPVSMGNFATIVFAFCLSAKSISLWQRSAMMALALVCIVLSDSRYGSVGIIIMIASRTMPWTGHKAVIFAMPVLTVLTMLMVGSFHELPASAPGIITDDFPGRLLFSSRLLDYWQLTQWFALAPSQVYVDDTGYAYFISNLGLPLAVFIWWLFAAFETAQTDAAMMKRMIALYLTTALCVGASSFSIKTAALLWFLYGSTNGQLSRFAAGAKLAAAEVPRRMAGARR